MTAPDDPFGDYRLQSYPGPPVYGSSAVPPEKPVGNGPRILPIAGICALVAIVLAVVVVVVYRNPTDDRAADGVASLPATALPTSNSDTESVLATELELTFGPYEDSGRVAVTATNRLEVTRRFYVMVGAFDSAGEPIMSGGIKLEDALPALTLTPHATQRLTTFGEGPRPELRDATFRAVRASSSF